MAFNVTPKFAFTVAFALKAGAHEVVPVHAPLQPVNREVAPAAAVSVTAVPVAKFAVHVPGQLIPAGELVTVPVPGPLVVTANDTCGVVVKVAVTAVAAVGVMEQAPDPLHAPPQLANENPVPGVSARVTCVPESKFAEHVLGHVMPAGVLVTVPVPETVTVICVCGFPLKLAVTVVAVDNTTVHAAVPLQAPLQPVNDILVAGVAASVT
jgi:hypothetical protein